MSNDGKLIVFRQLTDVDKLDSNPDIWMMNPDGSELNMIIENGTNPDLWVKE